MSSNVLTVKFNDFTELCKEKRVYFFNGEENFDFHIIADGMIVKSIVNKAEIENLEQFLSNQVFFNATELKFNLPIDNDKSKRIPLDIRIMQGDEVQNVDIQKEGVIQNPGMVDGTTNI